GAGALSGLLTGIGVNTLFLVAPHLRPLPLHEGVYGLAANVAVFVAVSLCTAPHDRDRLAVYMGPSRRVPEPTS
ncbi:MAG: pantothenate permease, partial [Bacteroidetes bacterium QH_2_64_74]